MKIQAAHRLMAAADANQARRFLEHYTGVKMGEQKAGDTHDHIAFIVEPRKVPDIKKKLDSSFKAMPKGMPSTFLNYAYYADDSQTRIITLSSWIDGLGKHRAELSLTDKNHYETYMQRMKRLKAEKGQQ